VAGQSQARLLSFRLFLPGGVLVEMARWSPLALPKEGEPCRLWHTGWLGALRDQDECPLDQPVDSLRRHNNWRSASNTNMVFVSR